MFIRELLAYLLPVMVVVTPYTGLAAQEGPAGLPVKGRTIQMSMLDGSRQTGELIFVEGDQVHLLTATGPFLANLAEVERLRWRRHGFGSKQAWTVVGAGAVVFGLGMQIACSSVDDSSCGRVLPAVAISFGLVGGLFAWGVAGSAWQDLGPYAEALRPYARFPQGKPPGYSRR